MAHAHDKRNHEREEEAEERAEEKEEEKEEAEEEAEEKAAETDKEKLAALLLVYKAGGGNNADSHNALNAIIDLIVMKLAA